MKNWKLFTKFAAVLVLLISASGTHAQTSPKQEQLLNGLKVLMWSDPGANKVTVRIRIHAGPPFDPQGKEGTMQLLADNIFPNEAARDFFKEDLGGSLDIVTTYDYIQINVSATPDHFVTMLETLASAVSNPTIDKDTTAKLRTALAAKIKTLEADPAYVADRAVAKRLLGTFPYGRSAIGTSESIQTIGFADLIDAKQRFLDADNATIAISGNFDRALGFKAVRRYFGNWLKSDKTVPSSFRQPDDPSLGVFTLDSPKPGVAAIRAAFRGAARGKEFAASEILARALETKLRARVPSINAPGLFVRNEAHVQRGTITVVFAVTSNDVGPANGQMQSSDLVAKALAQPLTDAEFQAARSAAAGEWTKRDVEESWLDVDTYKLISADVDRAIFDKVTLADVQVFAERLAKQPIAIVVVNTPVK